MLVSLLALLVLIVIPAAAQSQGVVNPDRLLLEATYVPCSDSTEVMFVFQDGRVLYATSTQGTMFTIAGGLLNDLRTAADAAESTVDTRFLDSCSTLGVILDGRRYMLINNSKPTEDTRPLQSRLERLRRFASRKLVKAMERLVDKAQQPEDTSQQNNARPEEDALRKNLVVSPIAREWKCRGSVTVAARITWDGSVRDLYIHSIRVRGKCAALLAISAMRCVALTKFEAARDKDGKPVSDWVFVQVPFK